MTVQSAKRASEILKEIKDLLGYKKLLADKEHGKIAHVAFVQHYGDQNEYTKVDFDHKYNNVFLPVIEGIIKNLEDELSSL